jgi:hypothetical protein
MAGAWDHLLSWSVSGRLAWMAEPAGNGR